MDTPVSALTGMKMPAAIAASRTNRIVVFCEQDNISPGFTFGLYSLVFNGYLPIDREQGCLIPAFFRLSYLLPGPSLLISLGTSSVHPVTPVRVSVQNLVQLVVRCTIKNGENKEAWKSGSFSPIHRRWTRLPGTVWKESFSIEMKSFFLSLMQGVLWLQYQDQDR